MKSGNDQQYEFFRTWSLKHWDLVNRLARRRFADEVMAEEAALWVLDRLEAQRWRKLAEYRGGAGLKTYFSSVVYNLLEDFSRQRFGRTRPPLWLKKLGGIWVYLYRLLCLERHSYDDAVHHARDRYPQLQARQIEPLADQILGAIPSCGQNRGQDVELSEADLKTESQSAPMILEDKERQQFLEGLHRMVFDGTVHQHTMHLLTRLTECPIELTAQERLLLTLHHREGLSVAEAGRKLGFNRFQAHGRMRRLYKRIREQFEQAGCRDEIRRLLEPGDDTTR